jgi:alkylated DNA repair dioxygenase AlkB
VPNISKIRAELYKFLIYEKGDKFKAHKDTIRSTNHIGSLVVSLPSFYEGGHFALRHQNSENLFQYSLSSETEKKKLLRYSCYLKIRV